MKIIGEVWVTEERIKKQRSSKNVIVETVIRTTTRNIDLECGHRIKCTEFNKVPSNQTKCLECEIEGFNI